MDTKETHEQKTEREFSEGFGYITQKVINESLLMKDALGYTNEQMESMYNQAYHLYNTGKYDEALQLFRALVSCNYTDPRYHLGLAACLHLKKNYGGAIKTYTFVTLIDPENPIPHYHVADCYIHLKNSLSAMVSLEMAIVRAEDKLEYKEIKERATLVLEGLKNQP